MKYLLLVLSFLLLIPSAFAIDSFRCQKNLGNERLFFAYSAISETHGVFSYLIRNDLSGDRISINGRLNCIKLYNEVVCYSPTNVVFNGEQTTRVPNFELTAIRGIVEINIPDQGNNFPYLDDISGAGVTISYATRSVHFGNDAFLQRVIPGFTCEFK